MNLNTELRVEILLSCLNVDITYSTVFRLITAIEESWDEDDMRQRLCNIIYELTFVPESLVDTICTIVTGH